MNEQEGVIKFEQDYIWKEPVSETLVKPLNAWRHLFYMTRLIGQNPARYQGAGYGNVSRRIEPYVDIHHKKKFLITGTKTGHLEQLTAAHYTTVLEYYPSSNSVRSEGPIPASSESMTHGTIYDADRSTYFIFHIHSPHIWHAAKALEIPVTNKNVPYGTPAMTEEVKRLFREENLRQKRIFSMGGHEDGIISFGTTAEQTGDLLVNYFAKALAL